MLLIIKSRKYPKSLERVPKILQTSRTRQKKILNLSAKYTSNIYNKVGNIVMPHSRVDPKHLAGFGGNL